MRCYIATRLERAEEQKALAAMLVELGHSITYDWSVHGSVQNEGPDRIREVAAAESDGVYHAELVIILLPGGRGTHAELGMALADSGHWSRTKPDGVAAKKKRIVIVGNDPGIDGRTCAFYHHPCVDARFADVPEFLAFMRGLAAAGGEWQ